MRVWFAPVAFAGAVLSSHQTARAQTSAVYDDAKAVIEELVTREVAQQVAKTVGCRLDGAMIYFPRSLQAIYDQQFGSLKSVMQDEVIELVAYNVYLRATGKGTPLRDGAFALVLRPPPPYASPTALWEPGTSIDTCKTNLDQKFKSKTLAAAEREPLDAACAKPAADERWACAVALATRATLSGDLKAAESRLAEAVALVLTAHLERHKLTISEATVNKIVVTVGRALANPSVDPKELWKAIQEVLLEEFSPGSEAHTTNTISAAVASEFVTTKLRPVVAEWQTLAASGQVKLSDFFGAALAVLRKDKTGAIAHTAGAVGSLCSLESDEKEGKFKFVNIAGCRAVANLAQFLNTEGAMAIIEAAQRRDYKALATGAIQALAGPDGRECTPSQKEKLAKAVCDLRATNAKYVRFATATFSYVLDVATQENVGAATRASFRETTIEIIQDIEPEGSGMRRRGWEKLKPWLPELALRYSWNSSYVNENGGNNARTVASLDIVGFRGRLLYRDNAYGAIQVSFIDLLAPFSEVAARKNGEYADAKYWWNLVTPRVEGLFGVPWFSHRLAVTVGGSLRMAAAYQPPATGIEIDSREVIPQPKYLTLFGKRAPGDTEGDHFLRFLEFNVGIKYLL